MTSVLVVDDEPQIRKALKVNLTARGYQVDLAATGEEALALAADHHPDVVLLDLGLPGIDGLEVCRRLKKNPATKDVAVYVVSGAFTSALEQKALEAGAVKCLPKPLDVRVVLSLMFPARGSELEARAQ